ncbi:MAG: RNA methyltransferase [Alphaproteobacteria bacterium]
MILIEPQLGENIGMAARAMANFSLTDLRLVAPRDGWPSKEAYSAASGATWVIEGARVFADVATAVADLNYVCATTARTRDSVKQVLSPQSAAGEISVRIARNERCGFMFGAEQSGLENDHIALCDAVVMAPVNPKFASLNLAQAVLIMGYEWLKQQQSSTLGRETEFDGPAREGVQMHHTRPATRGEMVGFFEHLERELDASGFLRPPEKRPQMVRNLRNMFQRMGASEQEVRSLRGVVSSLTRAHRHRDKMPHSSAPILVLRWRVTMVVCRQNIHEGCARAGNEKKFVS